MLVASRRPSVVGEGSRWSLVVGRWRNTPVSNWSVEQPVPSPVELHRKIFIGVHHSREEHADPCRLSELCVKLSELCGLGFTVRTHNNDSDGGPNFALLHQ